MSALRQIRRWPPPTPVTFNDQLRTRIETAIENLILLLDEIDVDPDLEDGADRECESEHGDPLDQGEGGLPEWQERQAYAA